MGSKKRSKKEISKKQKFFMFYTSLSINDKIAFKSFFFNYGRSRLTLKDFFTYPYFWQIGPLSLKNAITDGYTWM